MKHFDNIKDSLRNNDQLPEGYGWEDLGPGIQDRINDLNDIKKPVAGFNFKRGFYMLAALMMTILVIGFYLFFTQSSTPSATLNDGYLAQQNGEVTTIRNSDLTEHTQTSKKINDSQSFTLNQENNYDENKKELSDAETHEIIIYDKYRIDNNSFELKNIDERTDIIQNLLLGDDEEVKNVFSIGNTDSAGNVGGPVKASNAVSAGNTENNISNTLSAKTNSGNELILALHKISAPTHSLSFNRMISINAAEKAFSEVEVENSKKIQRFSLYTGFGLNQLNQNFGTSDISQERALAEKALTGYEFELRSEYKISDHFYFSSGLMYQQRSSRFDYIFEKQYAEEREDVLVGVEINQFNSEPVLFYSDTLVTITENRTIRHYNKYTNLSLPLVLGYYTSKGKFDFSIGAGVSYSFNGNGAGRTINDGELVDYNNNNAINDSNTGFALLAEAGIKMNTASGFFVGSFWGYQSGLKNISLEENIDYKISSVSGRVCIGINF